MYRKISITVVLMMITYLLLIGIDRIIGSISPIHDTALSNTFFLPPNTSVRYQTSEFNFLVQTNSLGYRGQEYSKPKPVNTTRILVFGDSFTYGWGVALEDTWPYLLEKELNTKSKGPKYEVINLARAGFSPDEYLQIAQYYIPYFNPDFVLIGLLEAEDLSQEIDRHTSKPVAATNTNQSQLIQKELTAYKENITAKLYKQIQNLLKESFPHFYERITRIKTIEVKPVWIKEASQIVSQLDDETAKRYEKISPFFRKKFISGDIQPGLLWLSLHDPDFFVKVFDLSDKEVIEGTRRFSGVIRNIDTISQKNGAITILIDIPYGIFVSEVYGQTQQEMGFLFSKEATISDIPSSHSRKLALENSIGFVANLEEFRKQCQNDCFYQYDGHMKTKGHQIVAENVLNYFLQNTAH